MSQLQTHRIVSVGALGDGVAEDGLFAPAVLPGEEIAGDVIEGRITSPKIINPSAERVKPRCRRAKACGGCVMQHASDDFVKNWKAMYSILFFD